MSLDMSAEEFRDLSRAVAQLATDHLVALDGRSIQPAVTGAKRADALGGPAPERGRGARVVDHLRSVVAWSRV